MKPIETERLVLRNWRDRDGDSFFRLNADPEIMRFFHYRRTRAEAGAAMARWRDEAQRDGIGFGAVEWKASGETIGIAGLHRAGNVPLYPEGVVEIGWRLVPEFWGRGVATEAARALLAHAFGELRLPEVVALAVWNNERSLAVMRRIGMSEVPNGAFDHPDVPDDFPHLKRYAIFRVGRADWPENAGAAS